MASSTPPEGNSPLMATHMSAQYDRLLQSPRGGTYSFTLEADEQALVLVNGTVLMDSIGADQEVQTKQLNLAPGNHHIQLRYRDHEGAANLRLRVGESQASSKLLEIAQYGSKATVI